MFQTSEPEIHIKFPEQKSHIEIDGFGNIYSITDNEIVKYNKDHLIIVNSRSRILHRHILHVSKQDIVVVMEIE